MDGSEKWTAYQFTKNVYEIWAPKYLQRIVSVIESLPPDDTFSVPALSSFSNSPRGVESYAGSDVLDTQSETSRSANRLSGTSFLDQSNTRGPKNSRGDL